MFHAEQFHSTRDSNDSTESKSTHEAEKSDHYGVGRGIESFGSALVFFHEQDEPGLAMSQHQIYQQQQYFEEIGNLDDLYLDVVSPPFQSCEDEITKIIGIESENTELIEPRKRQSYVFPHESFEVLRKYRSRHDKISRTGHQTQPLHARGPTLSTEIIIKMSAEKFIQSRSEHSNEPNHPYPSPILALSEEDSKEVQLVQNLLYSAEKVDEKQYDRAITFLKECDKMSSCTGTPIQRLVFYFSEALLEKIAKETRRTALSDSETNPADPLLLVKCLNTILIVHKQLPLSQITALVGGQTILHYLEDARKVHIVDLDIRSGVQWVQLMQDLAAECECCPIQHLKITAIGTKAKPILEETGRQLESFAESVNLKFTFKVVLVEDILDLNQNLLDLESDESVAVYAVYTLTRMTGRLDRLGHLMRVIRNLSPCVMVVTEMEANCSSPTFVGRFVESLFFLGALFDSLEDCLKDQETSRTNVESTWFRSSIRDVLAAEGGDSMTRHVNINAWRALFDRFGLVEVELSLSSLNQAHLVLHGFSHWSSFTLHRNGKCLTLGWKGRPISSLSAWKVQRY